MLTKLLVIATFTAIAAIAQPGGGGGGGGMGGMRARTPAKFEAFFDKLKLSKDQKEEVSTLFDDAQKDAAPLREQMMKGRQAIAEAMFAKKSDAEVGKLMEAYTQVSAQMTGIE